MNNIINVDIKLKNPIINPALIYPIVKAPKSYNKRQWKKTLKELRHTRYEHDFTSKYLCFRTNELKRKSRIKIEIKRNIWEAIDENATLEDYVYGEFRVNLLPRGQVISRNRWIDFLIKNL